MKKRIILKQGKYEAQIKSPGLFSIWCGLRVKQSNNYFGILYGLSTRFDTIEEAMQCIEEYIEQEKNDGTVVWEG